METIAKYKSNIEVVSDPESLAQNALRIFIAEAQKAIKTKDVFFVAISGGNTPRRFFELLAETPEANSLPWDKVQLFWVDERYVRPESEWSNYKLAADTFLARVPIPGTNIHRIPTEHEDFKIAANSYEQTIREVFDLETGQVPEFDLILLGMGSDGHTASLFPNSYAAFDTEHLACVVYVLDEKLNRITLTHRVLRAAYHLVILVGGHEKSDILKKVLTSEPDEVRYPIHTLWPVLDRVTWVVDKAAGKYLQIK